MSRLLFFACLIKWLYVHVAIPVYVAGALEDFSFLDDTEMVGNYRSNVLEPNGLVVLQDVEHVSDLLHDSQSSLVLVALYSSSCPHSSALIQKLEEAIETLSSYLNTSGFPSAKKVEFSGDYGERNGGSRGKDPSPPMVAKLDASHVGSEWIKTLGIHHYPSLYFFRQVEDETVVMEYVGLTIDPMDITDTILHTWYRHEWGPLIPVASVSEVKTFVEKHSAGMLRHVLHPLNPDYTEQERASISWLMESTDDDPDPYLVFVQCRNSHGDPVPIYKNFTDLASMVSSRRDVVLFAVEDCVGLGDSGDIVAIKFHLGSFDLGRPLLLESGMNVNEFAVIQMTPSLLFYDRISTGPIAFGPYRAVHAILCVRLAQGDYQSYKAVRAFRKACQERKLEEKQDMVCLVVPESETRILTTFGVDIWTSLDAKVSGGRNVPDILPVLIITDQRQRRFRRYYLSVSEIIRDMTSIPTFIERFWSNELAFEIKSSSSPSRVNAHGVEIINAGVFEKVVVQRQKHTLLYLHAPTCGHCKRFSNVWNALATMVRAVKWDLFLDVLKMDVTENTVEAVDPAFLPAVYYFPLNAKQVPFEYTLRDNFGDSVGRLQDPTEILDWMLTVGAFDEVSLLQQINLLLGEDTEAQKTIKEQN